MSKQILEHLISIGLVSAIFVGLIGYFYSGEQRARNQQKAQLEWYLQLDFLDFNDPLHKALLKETLNIYYPNREARHDSLLRAIEQYRTALIAEIQTRRSSQERLTGKKFLKLSGMYAKFILAYLLVMVLTYYGVQTLAVWRFVKMKQGRTSYLAELAAYWRESSFPQHPKQWFTTLGHSGALLGKTFLKGLLYFILFAPAYVIAYSFKTRFDTDSFFFMILLGVISNGLLITYAQKFYTFLVTESRRGYVQTALVKNLRHAYSYSDPNGIPLRAILHPRKSFAGHVFQHIFINARYQYISTIKEQASFLITGLVIIEMALNIQGHLCYELLQNILYHRFEVALVIILGIFWVVKATEIFADYWKHQETKKYGNIPKAV